MTGLHPKKSPIPALREVNLLKPCDLAMSNTGKTIIKSLNMGNGDGWSGLGMLQKLLNVPYCSNIDIDIIHHVHMKRLVLLGLCFTLSLVLVLGTVSSSSPVVFAVDMGGTMEGGGGGNDGNNMPPPEDAPVTTDALTAGGSDNDDDDDENDDHSGGSGDDDNADSAGDKDENNDKDNSQIPEDAPATTNALTAKKIECPPGQEVALFSTSCEPTGAGSQDSTLAATMCPTSPTPTSYGLPDGLSVTNMIWEYSEVEIGQQDMQKTLLHRVQGQTAKSEPANPSYYCPPLPYQQKYEPPPGALPYKGNEAQLIESFGDIQGAKVTSPEGTNLGLFTFRDGTIMQVTIDSDPNNPSELTRHAKITPGSNTPLDRLGVVQVDLPSSKSKFDTGNGQHALLPPNSKPGTGGEFVHKIQYNDGTSIIASKNGNQEFWDVYDSNNRLKSTTMADPATKTTAIENKQDNSVTFHPQGANSYTVYPRAADGTQKTVTVTSEGQPVVTVRDANGNVIPPRE
jgi:hypothetical protein